MVNISPYDIDYLKPIVKEVNKGNFSICYKWDNDNIIKIFRHMHPKYKNRQSIFYKKYLLAEEKLQELLKIKIDNVALPSDLVYINGEFAGFIMPYFKGSTLSKYIEKKINNDMFDLDEINDIYNSLYYKINLLSSKNIVVNDIKPDNIIVLNNDFCIIDVDFYYIDKERSKKDILKKNIIELNKGILKLIKLVVLTKKDKLNGLLELTESADFSIYKYTDEDLEDKEFINKLIYSIKNK